jgi:hypothetical protein
MREDKKESERIDRKAARASAMGENDDLAKYNQYLADLANLANLGKKDHQDRD